MRPCRECRREVSEQAIACPQCGAPYPARRRMAGDMSINPELPFSDFRSSIVLQVSSQPSACPGKRHNRHWTICLRGPHDLPIGIGIVSVSQFTLAVFALAQFAVAVSLAQLGIYLLEGHGEMVKSIVEILGML